MLTVNGQVSHWFDEQPAYRAPLPGDRDADICIVGAGYTGLWTAYYLKRADPSLRIAILEARFAGFGASGRNGGWLSGLVPGNRNAMAERYGREPVVAWQRALNETVDEVAAVAAAEGIDAGIVKGGTMEIARNAAQANRLADELHEDRRWGVDGIAPLTKGEAAERTDSTVWCRRTTPRTAHASNPPTWPAGWPMPSNASVCRSTNSPR
ncbi:UNVERIFIED_ORG: glycine/D-amino acid oxidase-like deaminating enzyme [Mycolicibacterium obuense]